MTYLGVFDGFDGDVASTKCSMHLHMSVLNSLVKLGEPVECFNEDEINNLEKYSIKENEQILVQNAKETTVEELSEEEITHLRNYKYSMENAFWQMDKLLSRGKDEKSKTRWSGATGCACVIERSTSDANSKGWIHIANCGIYSLFLNSMNIKIKMRKIER